MCVTQSRRWIYCLPAHALFMRHKYVSTGVWTLRLKEHCWIFPQTAKSSVISAVIELTVLGNMLPKSWFRISISLFIYVMKSLWNTLLREQEKAMVYTSHSFPLGLWIYSLTNMIQSSSSSSWGFHWFCVVKCFMLSDRVSQTSLKL